MLNFYRIPLQILPSPTKIELSVTRSMSNWVILESPWLVGLHFFKTSSGYIHLLTLLGRVGHQKRIRKLIRMLSFSAGIHVVVWEECYCRWQALNESMSREGSTSVDGADSGSSHSLTQQARFLSFLFTSMTSRSETTGCPFSMAQSDFVPCCSGRIMHSNEARPLLAGWSYSI